MQNEDLKKDLENFMKKQLEPFHKNMLEQEKVKHEQFLRKHSEKYEAISEKHSSSISQLITLEGVIFTAIVVFTSSEHITLWLILGICFILVSLIFGIWSQSIGIQALYDMQEFDYNQEMKNHWWTRELWKDGNVKTEKELIEPHLKGREDAYKKRFQYKLLKWLHLNADRIENLFKLSFIISMAFLILHTL